MGLGGQRHAPTAVPPGKTRYPLYRRLGGPQGPSGWVRKISPTKVNKRLNNFEKKLWNYTILKAYA
jgi:hypothetical protein